MGGSISFNSEFILKIFRVFSMISELLFFPHLETLKNQKKRLRKFLYFGVYFVGFISLESTVIMWINIHSQFFSDLRVYLVDFQSIFND